MCVCCIGGKVDKVTYTIPCMLNVLLEVFRLLTLSPRWWASVVRQAVELRQTGVPSTGGNLF